MPVHSLETCLEDCAQTYVIKGLGVRAKQELYKSAWVALNRWIETKLAKQLGAGVSGLGCFAWEIKQKNGETSCRPIFVISDSFVKSFNVKKERTFRLPRTTPVETVNYTNLAIKFTENLTKDMMFVGVRDIIKKIGDYVYRAYDFEIDFTFGKLISSEKRVRFEFNASRIAQMLPEAIETGFYQYDTSDAEKEKVIQYNLDDEEDPADATKYMDALEDSNYYNLTSAPATHRSNYSSSSSSSREQQPQSRPHMRIEDILDRATAASAPSSARRLESAPFDSLSYSFGNSNRNSNENSNSNNESKGNDEPASTTYMDYTERPESALPTDLKALLDRIERKDLTLRKDEFRKKASDRVLEQAYIRSLDHIEKQAKSDDKIRMDATKGQVDWKEDLARTRAKHAEDGVKLNNALKEQLGFRAEQRRLESREKKESIMHVFLHDRPNSQVQDQKESLKRDLQAQISEKVRTKTLVDRSNMDKERDYLSQLSLEIDLHKTMERASHLEKQKTMLEAWERDGHVKNLRKVQSYGQSAVKDYILANLGNIQDTVNDPLESSLGNSLKMSIGYDPRKGRIQPS